MKRWMMLVWMMPAILFLRAQTKTIATEDSINERTRASETLRHLKDGSVIVRLKTNDKSVEAYRKAGKNDIADRIESDREKQNQKIYAAFVNHFNFCKVFFIYAHETQAFLNGERNVFLNKDLQHDRSILLNDQNFVFCEYGSAEPFSDFTDDSGLVPPTEVRNYNKPDSVSSQTSTSPVYGFFFSDKNLRQFKRPFPYVEDAYFGSYNKAVIDLNRSLHNAYGRLVVNKDFRDLRKQEKKKYREAIKSHENHSNY